MKLKMMLKNRPFFFFQICFFLIGLLAFSLGSAYADKENPGPNLPAASKPMRETEQTNPHKVPYVGPQSKNDGPQEATGASHLITPSILVNDQNPKKGKGGSVAMAGLSWGKDIYASSIAWPPTCDRFQTSLATHSNNRLYIAYVSHAYGVQTNETFISLDYSDDAGLTWKDNGLIYVPGVDLSDPSIAVTNDTVVVAYVVHPTTGDPYIEVATASLTGSTWTAHSILHWGTLNYGRRPMLWTDYNIYPASSSVYLTYEWVVDAPTNNINIDFQRSADDGATWKNHAELFGGSVADQFVFPSGCFGEVNHHMLYVAGYNKTTKTLVLRKSSDWGVTWGAEQDLYTLAIEPNSGAAYVHPSIAAATTAGLDNVIVAYCEGYDAVDDDINYLVSYNNGATWNGPYVSWLDSNSREIFPFLIADPKGSYFHLFCTTWVDLNPIYYTKRAFTATSGWGGYYRVNSGGKPSISYPQLGIVSSFNFGFPSVVWTDYGYDPSANKWYAPFFNRLVPDDLVGTWTGDGTYFRSDIDSWFKLGTPATQVTAGDLDGDGTADIAGVWPSQSGAWVYKSSNKGWVLLGSTPVDIGCGDMDGNGSEDFVATWDGQGVYYKTSISGSWVKLATPATLITAGDLDNDGTDDLIGIWPSQGGVWVKYSATGTWAKLGSTAAHIATGDMNGDGKVDLLGTWDGQGVYYRNSVGGAWVKMATPATLIASGDLDGDGTDDLIGIWPAQSGVWVKYSSTGAWKYISSTAADISAGKMRGGASTWGASAASLAQPAGGSAIAGPLDGPYTDLYRTGPGGSDFVFRSAGNLKPMGAQAAAASSQPGPGEPGFACSEQENLVPQMDEKEKPEGERTRKQK